MAVNLSPIWGAGAQLFDNSGNVLSGGKIYTYSAGTTTPAVTYTDTTGNTAHSNPIILNSAGRVPYEIWLDDTIQYKFVLKDSNDTLIGTWDNIDGVNSNFVAYTGQNEYQTAVADQTVFTLTEIEYIPGANNLMVFVDGINQYGPNAQYAFVETDSTTVTFTQGLHEDAQVRFTTATVTSVFTYSVLSGPSNPTSGDGVNGDFYINTTTYYIFGPKTDSGWGTGTSLVGPAGATGPAGPTGPAGAAATIAAGTTTTGAPGSSASVVNSGTSSAAVFDFTIPQGATGTAGNGIVSVTLTSGTHAPGTLDTYTILFTDGSTTTFQVYNGANGTGSGTVTSVDISGGTTGLTTSGGPITSTGTITLAGTLAVANGGTGQTSYTNGQLLIGNSTGNTLSKATLTAGTGVSVTNGAGAITITNSAPDQTVSLTAGTGISVSGTYPSFTVANTGLTAYPGSGIPVSTGSAWSTSKTAPSGDIVGTSDSQTLTDKTLTDPTVSAYTESVAALGTVSSSATIAITAGTVVTATLTASTACTFTMPTATAGKSFVLLLKQAASTGNGTATFTGVKWGTAGAPTITATAGKMDILTFVADGTNWYGSITQGYTP